MRHSKLKAGRRRRRNAKRLMLEPLEERILLGVTSVDDPPVSVTSIGNVLAVSWTDEGTTGGTVDLYWDVDQNTGNNTPAQAGNTWGTITTGIDEETGPDSHDWTVDVPKGGDYYLYANAGVYNTTTFKVTTSNAEKNAILNGLQELVNLGNNLDAHNEFAQVLEVIQGSVPADLDTVGEAVDIGDMFQQGIYDTVSAYYAGDATPTPTELVTYLSGLGTVTSGDLQFTISSVSGGYVGSELTFAFVLDGVRTNTNVDATVNLGETAYDLGITFPPPLPTLARPTAASCWRRWRRRSERSSP